MITTLCLLQLIAFEIWYVTSPQFKSEHRREYVTRILRSKRAFRIIGLALLLVTTIMFVVVWGWLAGICAALVSLMTIGSLVVVLHPFRYLNEKKVAMLFTLLLVLEYII
jgi:hypothetical protein